VKTAGEYKVALGHDLSILPESSSRWAH